jgi:tRNA(adenine34) deaminase
MWNDLEKGFQTAFEKAWEAYKNHTVPIGVAIMDKTDMLMATGQNQIYTEGEGVIKLHQVAHAEINAILELSEIKDPNIRKNIRTFTLYSTMEPCPLCFGAVVMGSIRNVKYAARDNYAGAALLNESLDYIKNKKITVTGPFEELETVQIAMQVCFELYQDNQYFSSEVLLQSWAKVCEKGVLIGKYLYENKILENMLDREFKDIYDLILSIDL